jgi:hypothetical protein
MALSVAVPIRLAISSLVNEILIKPSGSVPNFCSKRKELLPIFLLLFFEQESYGIRTFSQFKEIF